MNKIAVIGAQTNTGREILSFLDEGGYKAADVIALEPRTPLGTQISYSEDEDIDVLNLDDYDFSGVDVAVFAGTEEISKHYIPRALAKGEIGRAHV